jgi:hypothetical protein
MASQIANKQSFFKTAATMSFQGACLFVLAVLVGYSDAFAPKHTISRGQHALFALPTIEQLSNDPFMKQVQYGSELTGELMNNDNPNDDLGESIRAQLSHSAGIRGFMVSYLTADTTPADDQEVPSVLLDALKSQAEKDPEDLISLACK